nr:g-type lectin s-receptor-like serine/threonine-protein kinase rks1 [Quercus suber]
MKAIEIFRNESFDYPTDTLLPEMKIGLNRITGINSFLTSWKSQDEPGTGNYSFKLNLTGFPQLLLYEGSTPHYRAIPRPWNTPVSEPSLGFTSNFVNNEDEIFYFSSLDDPSIITALDFCNYLRGMMVIVNGSKYGQHQNCVITMETVVRTEYVLLTALLGLHVPVCQGFVKVAHLKAPDTFDAAWMDMSMSSLECEQACLRNCSCTAFINYNTNGKGFSCLSFYGELIGILEFTDYGWDLNVRVDATELAKYTRKSKGFLGKKRKLAITILSVVVPLFLVSLLANMWLMKKRKTKVCTSVDTLTPDQSIKDDQSLISNKNNFALGFFSPGNSSYRYLGIWFVKVPNQTIVWVANRNDPIIDSSGVLSINQYGNLVLHDSSNRLLWSTNVSVQGTTSSVAQLQDSGNLVLVQGNNEKVIWQSFDHPTDTLLPRMRLGLNRITGLDRFLTSWKSQDDPGTGDYFYKMNPTGSPQVVLYKGSTLYWRTSPWPWPTSSSAATSSSSLKYYSVNNEDEVSYAYFFDDAYIISRVVLHNSGLLQLLMWNDGDLQWKEFWSAPKYRCDNYRHCGASGKCGPESASFNRFECTCLPGYEPKSPKNWYHRDGSEGCVRKQLGLSMCGNGEGFVKVELLKGPDSVNAVWMDKSMSSSECEQACLRNCSCTAFVSINIDGKGNSCLTWYGELNDISESSYERWDLNVRVDATELATYTRKSNGFLGHKRQRAISIISLMVTLFLDKVALVLFLRVNYLMDNK